MKKQKSAKEKSPKNPLDSIINFDKVAQKSVDYLDQLEECTRMDGLHALGHLCPSEEKTTKLANKLSDIDTYDALASFTLSKNPITRSTFLPMHMRVLHDWFSSEEVRNGFDLIRTLVIDTEAANAEKEDVQASEPQFYGCARDLVTMFNIAMKHYGKLMGRNAKMFGDLAQKKAEDTVATQLDLSFGPATKEEFKEIGKHMAIFRPIADYKIPAHLTKCAEEPETGWHAGESEIGILLKKHIAEYERLHPDEPKKYKSASIDGFVHIMNVFAEHVAGMPVEAGMFNIKNSSDIATAMAEQVTKEVLEIGSPLQKPALDVDVSKIKFEIVPPPSEMPAESEGEIKPKKAPRKKQSK